MNNQAYVAMGERLRELREQVGVLRKIQDRDGGLSKVRAEADREIKALEDALIGDERKVLMGIGWLKECFVEYDCRWEFGGNETWVLADAKWESLAQRHAALGVLPASGERGGRGAALDQILNQKYAGQFAIWRATGCVYRVGPDGAVEDDPIYDPMEVHQQ